MKSNKIIQWLVKEGKLEPKGLPHHGGEHYVYENENDEWGGNIRLEKLGKAIYDLTDDEIDNILNT